MAQFSLRDQYFSLASRVMKSTIFRGNSSCQFPGLRTQAQTSGVRTWRSVLWRTCLHTGHVWLKKKKKIVCLLGIGILLGSALLCSYTWGIWTNHLPVSTSACEIRSHWVWSGLSGVAAGVTGARGETLQVWSWIQSADNPSIRDPPRLMPRCCGWESTAPGSQARGLSLRADRFSFYLRSFVDFCSSARLD